MEHGIGADADPGYTVRYELRDDKGVWAGAGGAYVPHGGALALEVDVLRCQARRDVDKLWRELEAEFSKVCAEMATLS